MLAAGADDVLSHLLELAIGAGGGVLGTIVTLRTWRYRVDRDLSDGRAAHAALEARVDENFRAVERRQILQLQLTAHICRKIGIDGRFDDLLVRVLSADPEII